MNYEWALNKQKMMRAIQAVGNNNETAIKEYYVKIGGLVLLNSSEKEIVLEKEKIENTIVKEEPLEVKPKKRGRPKKNDN